MEAVEVAAGPAVVDGERELSGRRHRSRSAAGPMSGARSVRRRLFYGCLRELPAARAEGPREAVGGWARRAR